jgi:hypothetical protein
MLNDIYQGSLKLCLSPLHSCFFFGNENQPDALLSLIYFVTQPLHVSGIFTAHRQDVFTVYVQQLVCVICLS